MRCWSPLLLVLLLAPPALSAGVEIHEAVPRQVAVSVAKDHLFASVRARVTPSDLGLVSWVEYDVDGSGALDEGELRPLLRIVRDAELEHLCVALDGEVLQLRRYGARLLEPAGEFVPLDAPLAVRIEGRRTLDVDLGEHRFVLYDRPRGEAGVVPIRLSLVVGMRLTAAQGARSEMPNDRRLETAVTRFAGATWGTFVRDR